MNTIIKTLALFSLLLTASTHSLTISELDFPQKVDLYLSELEDMIYDTASATLYPKGSLTAKNCKKDSHCIVASYSNNCDSQPYSTYKSRGAKEAIENMTLLHDTAFTSGSICFHLWKTSCQENRCRFEKTVDPNGTINW